MSSPSWSDEGGEEKGDAVAVVEAVAVEVEVVVIIILVVPVRTQENCRVLLLLLQEPRAASEFRRLARSGVQVDSRIRLPGTRGGNDTHAGH